jgi:RNA polymerase sigma factor (sigma-70 family)
MADATVATVERERGLVVIGDAIGSTRDSAGTADWLRGLAAELDVAYDGSTMAPFGFTRGDEVRGLLRPEADPIRVVLHATLAESARPIRWALTWGEVDPAPSWEPASGRSGPACGAAESMIEEAKRRRERLLIRTGDAESDALLAGMAPALMDMLAELTPTQRHVARLAVIEGLRQSEVAERLGVRRATISVSFARARISSIDALAGAIRAVCSRAPVPVPAPAATWPSRNPR